MSNKVIEKNPHLNSFDCFSYVPNASPSKNKPASESIYLRYRTAETKCKYTYG